MVVGGGHSGMMRYGDVLGGWIVARIFSILFQGSPRASGEALRVLPMVLLRQFVSTGCKHLDPRTPRDMRDEWKKIK